jgi:hypothetical protein
MSITQAECVCVCVCVFVALVIQQAVGMLRIDICGLPRCAVFFHITSHTVRFEKQSYWTQNVCFDFLYNLFLKHISF